MKSIALELIVRYVHFLSIFGIVGALVSEHLLIDKSLPRKVIKRLQVIDNVYGVAAILMIASGFTMWFAVGKPAEFYTSNGLFHTKVGLAILLGILSIWPTVFFFKNRKGDPEELVEIPKKIVVMIRIELLILFLIPMLAILMAKGIPF
ncbi:MAG: DUF2214 family protein [Bacteroidota bacterium]